MRNFLLIAFVSMIFFNVLSAQDVAMVDHSTSNKSKHKITTSTPPFTPIKSVAPIFEGGHAALVAFMELNLQYPSMGLEFSKEGVVIVECTIATDGSVQAPKIIKSLGFGFDQEVLRLVGLMPDWQPAQHGTRKVATRIKIPVSFSLR